MEPSPGENSRTEIWGKGDIGRHRTTISCFSRRVVSVLADNMYNQYDRSKINAPTSDNKIDGDIVKIK
jgi:hypothetical protein